MYGFSTNLASLLFIHFIINGVITIEASPLPMQRMQRVAANTNCTELQPDTLARLLGGAINTRYMRIVLPSVTDEEGAYNMDDNDADSDSQRHSRRIDYGADSDADAFAVNGDTFLPEVSLQPAWNTVFNSRVRRDTMQRGRVRRDTVQHNRPWSCRGQVKWRDLGRDYFPRFLRSVDCLKEKCWYGHGMCRPRSFMVRILRRRNGECEPVYGSDDYVPTQLREAWTWEEYPVNFCCECCVS